MHFSLKLINWYNLHQRDFPWRKTKNPYFIWLSEIILQQTRTFQGLPYYLAFIKKYPTVFDLAKADETNILKIWQGLGYYSRARNLHFSAKFIVHELKGKFPANYTELLQLKGVGDYTASAIASICYDEKTAVVDGNVYRVLARYFGIETIINSTKGVKEFKLLAQELLPKSNFGLYNQAIMDFGAIVCTPKKPKCDVCIFKDSCVALQKNKVLKLPIKITTLKIKKRYFNYLILIDKANKIILNKRTGKDIWQNLYEFPLLETKIEIDKNRILKKAIYQKLISKKNVTNLQLFNEKIIIHKLSHQHIYTKFWIVNLDVNLVKSIPFNEIENYPVSTLVHNFSNIFKNFY
ncbi:MAG: A/G-specific adenine glycosylase [Flavobacteriaceae bacterium]|nr:A/G-specific adenine glycosylase [Flavobacteriaceae bacterium]